VAGFSAVAGKRRDKGRWQPRAARIDWGARA
jgi:hypothetical protein